MLHWTAPNGTRFVFSLSTVKNTYHPTLKPPGGLTVGEATRMVNKLCRQVGIPVIEYYFSYRSLDLRDRRVPELYRTVMASKKAGMVTFNSIILKQPKVDPDDPHAWFEITTGNHEFRSASRTPPDVHLAFREHRTVVSQKFRSVVERAKLRGLDWLPLESTSPQDRVKWFEVYATHPIGRGLDHPLIDVVKANQDERNGRHKHEPAYYKGLDTVWKKFLRGNVAYEPALISKLVRFPNFTRIEGPARYVREHLPRTDFAYLWGAVAAEFDFDRNGPTPVRRDRDIYCNARARNVLIKAGLLKPSRFIPVQTVPAAEAQTEVLDRTIKVPVPLPNFTPAEAAQEKKRREAAIRAKKAAPRRPKAPPSIKKLIAVLKKRLKDGTSTWKPAKDHRSFAKMTASRLYRRAPHAWQQIAPYLPWKVVEEESDFFFEMCTPAWNDWLADDTDDIDPTEAPSKNDLVIGCTPFGDWFSVRKDDKQLPKDARISYWNHETLTNDDAWPTVAAFAAHLIEMSDLSAAAAKT